MEKNNVVCASNKIDGVSLSFLIEVVPTESAAKEEASGEKA